jgi:hypothetical protein
LYEWYEDVPPELSGRATAVAWDALIEQWSLLEFDFTHLLHVRLEKEFRRRSFRWFSAHVRGLFAVTDSQGHPVSLAAKFFAQQEPADTTE